MGGTRTSAFNRDRNLSGYLSEQGAGRRRCRISSVLLAVMLAVFWMPGRTDAEADGGVVARSVEGWEARAVCWEMGPAAVTEVWVQKGEGAARRLGVIPGRPGGLGWSEDGDRVLYREAPLELPVVGVSVVERRTAALVAGGVWEVPVGGGKVRRLKPGEADALPPLEVNVGEVSGRAGEEVQAVLSGVGTALQAAGLAYYAMHQGDFKEAADGYRRAARMLEALPKRFGGAGLLQAPVEAYARALKGDAQEVRKEGARRVCRERLLVIGDMLRAFAQAHGGAPPEDLAALKGWVEAQGLPEAEREALGRLFRALADPEAEREASYFYFREASPGQAVVTSFFYKGRLVELVRVKDRFEVRDRAVGKAQVDSLLGLGVALLEAEDARASHALEMVVRIDPKRALGHCKLGYAYLKDGEPDRALASFERAALLDHRLAEAYNGLGLVFQERPKARYDAIRYFQKALQYDRDYLEARYNMAKIRYALKEHDVKWDAERMLEIDPNFAPAYRLLGDWYETFQKDYEQAALHYAQYMSLKPDDPDGRRRLAEVYLKAQNYERIYELLAEYARKRPDDVEVLPVLAQACVKLGFFDRAEVYFATCLERMPAEERALFQDVRLLASSEEYRVYEGLPETEREAFLHRFWAERDPDLTTAANERRLEHYRRVWYARQHFSEGQQPWDRRGEVYVRFGEPDYRSRSDFLNFEQSLGVQRVKERMVKAIYGNEVPAEVFLRSATDAQGERHDDGLYPLKVSPFASFYPGPVYPVRGLRATLGEAPEFSAKVYTRGPGGGAAGLGSGAGQPEHRASDALPPTDFRPVSSAEDASIVAWESWVYVDVAGGIEITFTDEYHRGIYDYAPSPQDARLPVPQMRALHRYNPKIVTHMAARATPNYYVVPENEDPLEFYYDLADFRGREEGASALEVYTGVPRNTGHYAADRDETRLEVERIVAALDLETGAVYRAQGEVRFYSEGDLTAEAGAFVPDVARLDLPPGTYRMEVQVRDRRSRRHGRYRQEVVVKPYGRDTLGVSDLELAWRISRTQAKSKFSKGDLQVVPMPTRTYGAGENVFVYYEVYNLARDAFGQTRYRVSYSIGPKSDPSLVGVISRLARLRGGKREEVAVTYEQAGDRESEVEYVELEPGDAAAGQYVLRIAVTDLNSGKTAVKKAAFTIK